jgi:hypothetical protein
LKKRDMDLEGCWFGCGKNEKDEEGEGEGEGESEGKETE